MIQQNSKPSQKARGDIAKKERGRIMHEPPFASVNEGLLRRARHPIPRLALWLLILNFSFWGTVFADYHLAQTGSHVSRLNTEWSVKEAQDPIAILFTGDIMLDRYIETLMERKGGTFPFTYMPDVLEAGKTALGVSELDLVVGNVEGPISDSTYNNPGTAMRFNFKPAMAQLLADVGFTTASLANNHTLDQGPEAYTQSHDYLTAAGIEAFGHPDIANGANTFISYDFDGTTVGFLGFNDAVTRLDRAAALAKIDEVASTADVLIVGIHWGIEYEATARANIQEFAHQMVDHGVDFIWGHHPHVVQNSEVYNGAPIYYSLGNFVFDQYWSKATQQGLVVALKIQDGKLTTAEIPVDLVNQGEPKPRD